MSARRHKNVIKMLKYLLCQPLQVVIFSIFCYNQQFVTSEERVIGDTTCDGIKHDFTVLITGINTTEKCGGTLLNSKWVLTAGHCCDSQLPFVFAGLSTSYFPVLQSPFHIYLVLMNDNVKGRLIERCILYEHIDPVHNRNNIALVKLKREIREGPAVSYVTLPNSKMHGDFHKSCTQATIMGWGKINASLTNLHCATQNMDAPDKCISMFGTRQDPKTILCAHVDGKSARIDGDDGGPLVCNNVQYGIITNQNGTYTRVDNYLEFIESNSNKGATTASNSISMSVIFVVHISVHMFR